MTDPLRRKPRFLRRICGAKRLGLTAAWIPQLGRDWELEAPPPGYFIGSVPEVGAVLGHVTA